MGLITPSHSAGTIAADRTEHFGKGYWWLARLYVLYQYRGKGLGTRLVKRLQEEIVKNPHFESLLVAPGGYDSDLKRLFEFYRRQGFIDREDGALIWSRP